MTTTLAAGFVRASEELTPAHAGKTNIQKHARRLFGMLGGEEFSGAGKARAGSCSRARPWNPASASRHRRSRRGWCVNAQCDGTHSANTAHQRAVPRDGVGDVILIPVLPSAGSRFVSRYPEFRILYGIRYFVCSLISGKPDIAYYPKKRILADNHPPRGCKQCGYVRQKTLAPPSGRPACSTA